ncbi:MAG: type II toxin-antitoxin system RelE/ParE family toxin [Pseudomonadota bacterium]
MAYDFVRTRDSGRDLELVFDHLFETYLAAGETDRDAYKRASSRLCSIEADMEALADVPHQGTRRPDWRTNLRHVTKDSAIFYFEVFGDKRLIRVLAVFFGGRNHVRHMLFRLGLGDST